MLKKEIVVGGRYLAKVSGNITIVRVKEIRERRYASRNNSVFYVVINEKTGRQVEFRSAAKFRRKLETCGV